jgi:MGT family glycosyltransferase
VEPAHARFNAFLDSIGRAIYRAGEFFETSPDLNLMLYAKPLRYLRQTPLESKCFLYLEGSVRNEGPYTPPCFPTHDDKPLVYLSFGSLGAADLALLERMIRLFSTLPYRFLINVGGYKDTYRFVPDNVQLDYWFPQPSVIAQSDMVIHHGGNNSVHEALYFGKPAITMPYCWDGHDNARRVADQDLGIHLDRYEWRDGNLIEVIETLMTGKARHKRLVAITKDMQAFDGCTRAAEAILKCAGI